jgi:hypothetical protein
MHVVDFKTKTQPRAEPPDMLATPDMVRSENDLCDRLADAMPGEIIPYYVGMLAADRAPNSLTLTEAQRIELNALADRMMQLVDVGRVHLVQRRMGPEQFVYLAIVRPQPWRRPHVVGMNQALRPDARRSAGDQAPHIASPALAGLPQEVRHAA